MLSIYIIFFFFFDFFYFWLSNIILYWQQWKNKSNQINQNYQTFSQRYIYIHIFFFLFSHPLISNFSNRSPFKSTSSKVVEVSFTFLSSPTISRQSEFPIDIQSKVCRTESDTSVEKNRLHGGSHLAHAVISNQGTLGNAVVPVSAFIFCVSIR